MNKKSKNILLILLASVIAVFFLAPLVWMVSTSLKSDTEAIVGGLQWLPKHFTFENYKYMFLHKGLDVPVMRWVFNSLFVGLAGTLIIVSIDAMAAYAL
ncbi:MAG TPA: carbohydrate ABC transporter permease, partial [Bacillales bacterium]